MTVNKTTLGVLFEFLLGYNKTDNQYIIFQIYTSIAVKVSSYLPRFSSFSSIISIISMSDIHNGGENMNRLKLILPTMEYKDEIMNYKEEFIKNKDSMDGTGGLRNSETFEEWYSAVYDNLKEETVREGFVPATTFIAISNYDGRLVGMIDIRHRLNDYLLNFGGHIGYSVRKSERQKGYATEMLALALKECIGLDIKRVLITCDKDNIASAKIIIKNGGILENEVLERNTIIQRYWIDLD